MTATLPWIQAEPRVFIAPDGARVTVRQVVTGGYRRCEERWGEVEAQSPKVERDRFPRLAHWTVSIDGRRVDSFLKKSRAVACAKAIVKARSV